MFPPRPAVRCLPLERQVLRIPRQCEAFFASRHGSSCPWRDGAFPQRDPASGWDRTWTAWATLLDTPSRGPRPRFLGSAGLSQFETGFEQPESATSQLREAALSPRPFSSSHRGVVLNSIAAKLMKGTTGCGRRWPQCSLSLLRKNFRGGRRCAASAKRIIDGVRGNSRPRAVERGGDEEPWDRHAGMRGLSERRLADHPVTRPGRCGGRHGASRLAAVGPLGWTASNGRRGRTGTGAERGALTPLPCKPGCLHGRGPRRNRQIAGAFTLPLTRACPAAIPSPPA